MASRTRQKEEARARRVAEEAARAERERRQKRTRLLAGVLIAAVAVVGVAIAISSSSSGGSSGPKPGSVAGNKEAAAVNDLLTGIPQSGNRLGSPNAKVVVTEFGDLECPICRDFALSTENQLIANDVRAGKVALVYKSLETATGNGPDPNIFPTQQAAAYAAGLQQKAWNYILLFYHEQGAENTNYVNSTYLTNLAKQVPGLNLAKWSSDRQSSSLQQQVVNDEALARTLSLDSTPSITVQGPKGEARPIVGDVSYSGLESVINSVQ